MSLIHDKIRLLIQDRGLSIRRAADLAGLNYRTLHSCLNEKRDVSFSTLQRVSTAFNVDFSFFSDANARISLEGFRSKQTKTDRTMKAIQELIEGELRASAYDGHQVNLQDFLNWWASNDGRLENFDKISQRVDMFNPPSSCKSRIRPIAIGSASLATKHFNLESADHLCRTLDGFSRKCNELLIEAHQEAVARREPVISHPQLEERLLDGTLFRRKYRRVLAPVQLPNGEIRILNYSEDIEP